MKIVLTGAAGVLGAPLARELIRAGYEVRCVDRVSRPDLSFPVEVVDLLDGEACRSLLQGADTLIHFANHSNEFLPDKARLLSENLTMNTNVFQAACEAGMKTIIFASSIQAIGAGIKVGGETVPTLSYLPIDGELPANPTNVYGLSKQLSEEMLRYYAEDVGINCVALRFPFIARTREQANRFREGVSTDKINEVWSYLSLGDACSLVLAILNASLSGFRVYCPAARGNGLGQPVTSLVRGYFPTVPLRQPIETISSLIDISSIEEQTGWMPKDEWISTPVSLPVE